METKIFLAGPITQAATRRVGDEARYRFLRAFLLAALVAPYFL
jgi:hypothetical protein